MNDDWLSAHLDDELSAGERSELEAALADDAELAHTYDEIARVRSMLRAEEVAVSSTALDRVISVVASADEAAPLGGPAAPVVALKRRRRIPSLAAAAAALVIIASVVGGLGGGATLPALGDLIDQHEAAAAVSSGATMPPEMDHMDAMSMDEASAVALPMPADLSMEHAFVDGELVHLLYRTIEGDAVSVFRHEGDADMDELGDGRWVRSSEADMWSAAMQDTDVAVVDGSGYVWVVIGIAPSEKMMDGLMHDLPTRSPSLAERVRDAADSAVEPFRVWD